MVDLTHEELVSSISTLFATARILSRLEVAGDAPLDTPLDSQTAHGLEAEFGAARAVLDDMAKAATDAAMTKMLRRVVDGCDEIRNRPPTSTLTIAMIADVLDAATGVVTAVPPLPR